MGIFHIVNPLKRSFFQVCRQALLMFEAKCARFGPIFPLRVLKVFGVCFDQFSETVGEIIREI